MVKVKSLDHTRFVITGTGATDTGRTLYFAGRRKTDHSGDWSTGLGGAEVFNNLYYAQFVMKQLQDYADRSAKLFHKNEPMVTFDVKLVQCKEIMVARLKYDGETI